MDLNMFGAGMKHRRLFFYVYKLIFSFLLVFRIVDDVMFLFGCFYFFIILLFFLLSSFDVGLLCIVFWILHWLHDS